MDQLHRQLKMLEHQNMGLVEVAKMAETRARDLEALVRNLSQRNYELETKALQNEKK
jgi:hypothetical protein